MMIARSESEMVDLVRHLSHKEWCAITFIKTSDNTCEGYDEETKMEVVLEFSDGKHDKEINDFFIKTLTDLYIRRTSQH